MIVSLKSTSRLALFAYIAVWLGCGLLLILFWTELPRFVSWPLTILEGLLAPDLATVKRMLKGDLSSND